LGVVSDKYKIVQNKEAFAFTDNLLDNEAKYVTAGSLRGGKNVWMLAELPETKILGDAVGQYLCFTNTHDGTGAVRVFVTPVRVCCNNTLNLALNTAKRSWSCRHMGNMESKMHEATRTLELANKYMEELATMADQLANTTVTDERLYQIVAEMFPVDEDKQSHRQLANMEQAKQEFMIAYFMPDIAKFRNTAWGMVNAMADMVAHSSPKRNTSTYQENNFERIVIGHPLLDLMLDKVTAKV
jgi:phage/plasmid-like protein (TIGR03299 family)